MTRFIGIASTKKGVGKTSIALNLTSALNEFNKDVTLVDFDFINSGLNAFLGVDKLPVTLKHVLEQDLHIKEAMYKHPVGFNVIPGESMRYYSHEKLKQKLYDLNGSTDLVVMDTNVGKGLLSLANLAEELVVVSTLDSEGLKDAFRTIRIAEAHGATVLGLVLNKVKGKINIEEIEHKLKRPVLGVIPEHKKISKAYEEKHPVIYLYPKSNVAKAYNSLASHLIRRVG